MTVLERPTFDEETAICASFFAQGSMLDEIDDHGENALARLLGGGYLEAANWLIPRWPNWREAEALFKARVLDGDWEDRMPVARAYFESREESREISKELNVPTGDSLPSRASRIFGVENEPTRVLAPKETQTSEAEPASKKKGSRRL